MIIYRTKIVNYNKETWRNFPFQIIVYNVYTRFVRYRYREISRKNDNIYRSQL